MAKLINTYRKLPTPSNRARLQSYLDKHMMAVCTATVDELEFLRANGFRL